MDILYLLRSFANTNTSSLKLLMGSGRNIHSDLIKVMKRVIIALNSYLLMSIQTKRKKRKIICRKTQQINTMQSNLRY